MADGVSYPYVNVDIFGNDIFDTSDDGIEADNGRANVRMWGNRIHNAVHNGISFQPQAAARGTSSETRSPATRRAPSSSARPIGSCCCTTRS